MSTVQARRIISAPRKPIPVDVEAPIRPASPNRDNRAVSMKTEEPRETMASVRTPAVPMFRDIDIEDP